MRQAGRYMPDYRVLREKAGSFMALCRNPEWAASVTLQPVDYFGLDAAIIFSDILTVPDAMGIGVSFVEQEGPQIQDPVRTQAAIAALPIVDAEALSYVMKAIEKTKAALKDTVPLIGFCGSPWTVATYMVEGGKSAQFDIIKKMAYMAPDSLHLLLHKITQSSIAYLLGQVQAGADVLMIFDTWGSVLSTPLYHAFSLAYMKTLVQAVSKKAPYIPIILFTKGGGLWLEDMAQTGCHALGLDWTIPLPDAHARVGHQVALQGNLDPCVLLAGPQVTEAETKRLLKIAPMQGYIVNVGHGLLPSTPLESVAAMVKTVKEHTYA
jgi:uroporphyrinogen decarboxylase